MKDLADPMLKAFWDVQWPAGGDRDRDPSIKAVLNELGAFVTYDSIHAVVGQGISTIRQRELMDRGEVLLVGLSGGGGDNENLFGAMLISRYYVDAVGRQGTARDARRQHLRIVDEAQRFATRALENISVEGRKFGLALTLASQSLGGLGERLSRTILTNAASIALLAPGSEDVPGLARLFAPVTAEQLSALRLQAGFILREYDLDRAAAHWSFPQRHRSARHAYDQDAASLTIRPATTGAFLAREYWRP